MTVAAVPKCPSCNSTLRPGNDGAVRILACLGCGYTTERGETREVALKLPGLDPGRQEVLVKEIEEPVFQRIVKALRMAGYQVETLVRRRKMQHCEKCENWFPQQGGDGVSKHVGDILVAVPRISPIVWIMLDTKGWRTPKSEGQKETASKRLLFFTKSVPEALAAVRTAEELLERQPIGPQNLHHE